MYDQLALEKKWQDYWYEKKIYRYDPESDKPVYSIDTPPRYASGSLHAGHAVHYNILQSGLDASQRVITS